MRAEVYQRVDGRYDWRLRARNGQIVATSGGQGYERAAAARAGFELVAGAFVSYTVVLADEVAEG